MCSFLILSLRVTPHIHRSILISVTSIRCSCLFVVAHVSAPSCIAGLITGLYTFPSVLLPSFCRALLRYSSPNLSNPHLSCDLRFHTTFLGSSRPNVKVDDLRVALFTSSTYKGWFQGCKSCNIYLGHTMGYGMLHIA